MEGPVPLTAVQICIIVPNLRLRARYRAFYGRGPRDAETLRREWENAMRKPEKPGTDAGKAQGGGALGNIDEQTGHPGKGTPGATIKSEDNPDPSKDRKPETEDDKRPKR